MTTATGPELAHRLGGTWLTECDMIRTPGHWIACRPTGRVFLDQVYQLGLLSDGVDTLAARYSAYVAGTMARLPGNPRSTDNDKQAA